MECIALQARNEKRRVISKVSARQCFLSIKVGVGDKPERQKCECQMKEQRKEADRFRLLTHKRNGTEVELVKTKGDGEGEIQARKQ